MKALFTTLVSVAEPDYDLSLSYCDPGKQCTSTWLARIIYCRLRCTVHALCGMICTECLRMPPNASERAAAVSYVTKQVLLWLQANFFNATAAFTCSSCTRCLSYFDVLIMSGKVGKVLILHRNRWHLHMIFPSYINKVNYIQLGI